MNDLAEQDCMDILNQLDSGEFDFMQDDMTFPAGHGNILQNNAMAPSSLSGHYVFNTRPATFLPPLLPQHVLPQVYFNSTPTAFGNSWDSTTALPPDQQQDQQQQRQQQLQIQRQGQHFRQGRQQLHHQQELQLQNQGNFHPNQLPPQPTQICEGFQPGIHGQQMLLGSQFHLQAQAPPTAAPIAAAATTNNGEDEVVFLSSRPLSAQGLPAMAGNNESDLQSSATGLRPTPATMSRTASTESAKIAQTMKSSGTQTSTVHVPAEVICAECSKTDKRGKRILFRDSHNVSRMMSASELMELGFNSREKEIKKLEEKLEEKERILKLKKEQIRSLQNQVSTLKRNANKLTTRASSPKPAASGSRESCVPQSMHSTAGKRKRDDDFETGTKRVCKSKAAEEEGKRANEEATRRAREEAAKKAAEEEEAVKNAFDEAFLAIVEENSSGEGETTDDEESDEESSAELAARLEAELDGFGANELEVDEDPAPWGGRGKPVEEDDEISEEE